MIVPIRECTATGSFILSHQEVIVPMRGYTTTNYFTVSNKLLIIPIEVFIPNLVIVSYEKFTLMTTSNPFCSHKVIVQIEEYTTINNFIFSL